MRRDESSDEERSTNNEWVVPGYTRVRELGRGATGRVVLASHDATDMPVAIKYLTERLHGDERFLSRFRAEAGLLGGLDDPNLVRFYEYVESVTTAAIIMELVDGVSLRELINAEGATGPEAALTILKGSLLGLAAAHAAGVVHRDYKPENVLVSADGASKLTDFGIAVRAGDDAPAAGTPAYMAPEQWKGAPVTPSADVYAATAVCYECLTGAKPFQQKALWALAAAHGTAPIPVESVPEPLRGLIAHGMAKDPAERPPSAEGFLAELEEAARRGYGTDWERRGRARLAALAALLVAIFPLAPPNPAGGTALALTRLGRRRVMVVAGTVAGVLLAAGGTGVWALVDRTDPPTTISAATTTPSPPGFTPTAPSATPTTGSPTPGTPTPAVETAIPTPGGGGPVPGTTSAGPASSPGGATSTVPEPPPDDPPPPPEEETEVTGVSVWLSTPGEGPATATITVTTSGTGEVVLSWAFTADGKPAGSGSKPLSGDTSYTETVSSTTRDNPCIRSWSVKAGVGSVSDSTSSTRQGCSPGIG